MSGKHSSFRIIQSVTVLLMFMVVFSGCDDGRRSSPLKFSSLTDDSLYTVASQLSRDPETADSAIICFTVLADRLESSADNRESKMLLAQTLTNLGFLSSNFRFDYQKAYSYLTEALEICREEKLDSIVPYIDLNIAVAIEAYGSLRKEHEATDSMTERRIGDALDMALKTRQWRPYFFAFHNLATIYTSRHDSASAARLTAGYDRVRPLMDRSVLSSFTDSVARGLTAWIGGKPLEAAAVFRRLGMCDNKDELQNRDLQYSAIGMSADMADVAGRHGLADTILVECARSISRDGSAGERKWIAALMASRYEVRGDSAMALAWRLEHYRAKDELQSQSSMNGLDGLTFMSRMRKVQDEIAAERLHKKRMSTVIVALTVFFVVVLVALSLYARYNYRRRRQIMALYREVVAEMDRRHDDSGREIDGGLIRRLKEILDNSDAVLLPDFSLTALAKEVGSNTSYVSHALNSSFGESFSTLVARRRIDEACMMLRRRDFDNLTVEAIAEKVGIKSRSNFSSLFKRMVGLTPTEFRNASRSGEK